MSIWSRVAAAFRPRNAGSVAPAPPFWHLRWPYYREAGTPITPDTALQVSAVYACCRLIVDSIAPAPIQTVEVKPEGVREVLHDDDVAYTLEWGASIDRAGDAPTGQAVEEALLWSALLFGNGYAEIQRDRAGKFFALWPIEPERVIPRRDEEGRLYYAVTQPGAYGGVGGGAVKVYPADMFHLRGPSLYGWVGDSQVFRAAKAVGIAQAAQVFASSYFSNGTVLSGLLTTDLKLTPAQAQEAKEAWLNLHANGPANSHGIAVVGGGVKFQPLGNSAAEAQLLESRRFQVQEIARFFGVPTTLLADNEAWTNLSELYLGFYRNALLPWAARFDAEATRKLFPQRKPWREIRHDLTHVVMGSFKDQAAALRQLVDGGIWTRNEAREITGRNHYGSDGDELVLAGTMKSLEDVLDPPEPLAPKFPAPEPGAEPKEPDGGTPAPVKTRPASSVARVAVALDRFERRMTARRTDLERNAPEKLAANLADERKKQEAILVAECIAALGDSAEIHMRVERVADAVLAGEPAHLAAERLAA